MFILWVPIWVVFLQRKGLGLTQIGLLEGFAWVLTAARGAERSDRRSLGS